MMARRTERGEAAAPEAADEALARQSQAGSLEAFERLVVRYEHRIYAFVANLCGNATDAREVTQATFVRAYQAIHQFDARRAFGPWLFTIARRKCVDHYRAAAPMPEGALPDLAEVEDPAELLVRQEERQQLWQLARRTLSPAQYTALWLRYVEEMDVAQIANVLGKTRTHIKVILFRARAALGQELEAARAVEGRRERGLRTGAGAVHSPGQPASAGMGRPGLSVS